MPVGNLNLLNVILPYGPAAQSGVVAYYPSYGNANRLVISGGGPVTTYYQIVQNAGSDLPQELKLDFSTGLTATDDPSNSRTVVTATGGGGNVFVYREGGTPAGNVYATFAAALAARAAVSGFAIIEFDNSLGSPQIPAGAYAIPDGTRFYSSMNSEGEGGPANVNVADGATFDPPPTDFENVYLLLNNSSVPNSSVTGGLAVTMRNSALIASGNAYPMYAVTGFGFLELYMYEISGFTPDSGGPPVTVDGSGAAASFYILGASSLPDTMLGGGSGGAFVEAQYDDSSSSRVSLTQSLFTGTYEPLPFSPSLGGVEVGPFASRGSASTPAILYLSEDGALAYVSDGTDWRPLLDGILGTEPPVAADWTVYNSGGTLTATDDNGVLTVNQNSSFNVVSGLKRPITPGSYTASAAFHAQLSSVTGIYGPGIAIWDGSSAKLILFEWAGPDYFILSQWTNGTTLSASVGSVPAPFGLADRVFMQIVTSGGIRSYQYSIDGRHWQQAFFEADTTFINNSETSAGPAAQSAGPGSNTIFLESWTP